MNSIKDMLKDIFQEVMEAELEYQLGYEKQARRNWTAEAGLSKNYRNGYSQKTIKASLGKVKLNVPRDRNGDYEPQIIEKYCRTADGMEEKRDDSSDKVSIIAEIAKLISEDTGGISFMNNILHNKTRSAGIEEDTAVIISLLVPTSYISYWKIPLLTPEDLNHYKEIILLSIKKYLEVPSNFPSD